MPLRQRRSYSGSPSIRPRQNGKGKWKTNSLHFERRQLASAEEWFSEKIFKTVYTVHELHWLWKVVADHYVQNSVLTIKYKSSAQELIAYAWYNGTSKHVVLHNVMEHAVIKKASLHTHTHTHTHTYTHTHTHTHMYANFTIFCPIVCYVDQWWEWFVFGRKPFVSTTRQSLFQRGPTDCVCVCVIECDQVQHVMRM